MLRTYNVRCKIFSYINSQRDIPILRGVRNAQTCEFLILGLLTGLRLGAETLSVSKILDLIYLVVNLVDRFWVSSMDQPGKRKRALSHGLVIFTGLLPCACDWARPNFSDDQ